MLQGKIKCTFVELFGYFYGEKIFEKLWSLQGGYLHPDTVVCYAEETEILRAENSTNSNSMKERLIKCTIPSDIIEHISNSAKPSDPAKYHMPKVVYVKPCAIKWERTPEDLERIAAEEAARIKAAEEALAAQKKAEEEAKRKKTVSLAALLAGAALMMN